MTDKKPTKAELQAEIERLRTLLDPDLTFRDIEMMIRDGTIDIRGLGDPENDTTFHSALRFLAAICLHVLLGEDEVEPENYRSCEFGFKPAGELYGWRLIAEIVKPGGRSSHEIRRELEVKFNAHP